MVAKEATKKTVENVVGNFVEEVKQKVENIAFTSTKQPQSEIFSLNEPADIEVAKVATECEPKNAKKITNEKKESLKRFFSHIMNDDGKK